MPFGVVVSVAVSSEVWVWMRFSRLTNKCTAPGTPLPRHLVHDVPHTAERQQRILISPSPFLSPPIHLVHYIINLLFPVATVCGCPTRNHPNSIRLIIALPSRRRATPCRHPADYENASLRLNRPSLLPPTLHRQITRNGSEIRTFALCACRRDALHIRPHAAPQHLAQMKLHKPTLANMRSGRPTASIPRRPSATPAGLRWRSVASSRLLQPAAAQPVRLAQPISAARPGLRTSPGPIWSTAGAVRSARSTTGHVLPARTSTTGSRHVPPAATKGRCWRRSLRRSVCRSGVLLLSRLLVLGGWRRLGGCKGCDSDKMT
jgi:hypothetical protein